MKKGRVKGGALDLKKITAVTDANIQKLERFMLVLGMLCNIPPSFLIKSTEPITSWLQEKSSILQQVIQKCLGVVGEHPRPIGERCRPKKKH